MNRMPDKKMLAALMSVLLIFLLTQFSLFDSNENGAAAKAALRQTGLYLEEFLGVAAVSEPAAAAVNNEHNSNCVVEIICTDENGGQQMISKVSREVTVGDEIITADNNHYRITELGASGRAAAEHLGHSEQVLRYAACYEQILESQEQQLVQSTSGGTAFGGRTAVGAENDSEQTNNRIGIYHTHSDESYVPSDGTADIPGNGGIYQVGEVFNEELVAEGIDTCYDTTAHDPHDSNAYDRSRVTAANLIKDYNPIAILDIHRDGIPDPEYYEATVDGEDITQVRLVVGRANPKMEANLDFAERLKAYSDEVYPGLIKEIYMAKGDYNQDLMSTALLIEAGTHTNTKEEAERGITLLANVIPTVLGIDVDGAQTQQPIGNSDAQSAGAWKAVGWTIAVIILAIILFLIISAGGVGAAWQQGKRFFTVELKDIWQGRRKNDDPGNDES